MLELAAFGFAAPWVMVGAAAVALPLLILLYCLRLRRREVMIGSTFLWQRAVEDLQANTPFQRIRPSWLLFLQLLALILLLLALGRPIWGETEVQGQRLILLVDISASMDALLPPPGPSPQLATGPQGDAAPAAADDADTNGVAGGADGDAPGTATSPDAPALGGVSRSTIPTRFDRAREIGLQLIDRLGRGGDTAEVMIIAFAARARTTVSFTSDRGRLRAALNGLEPVDEVGDLAGAIRLARAFAERADDGGEGATTAAAAAGARVVLISDGRLAAETSLDLEGLDFEYLPVLDPARFGPLFGSETTGVDSTVAANSPDGSADDPAALDAIANIGIVALSARRDETDPNRVDAFAVLQNSGIEPRTVAVELQADGVTLETRVVTIPAAAAVAAPEPAAAGPGEVGGMEGESASAGADASGGAGSAAGAPGEAVVGLSFMAEGSPVVQVTHNARDALASDDRAAVIVAPPRRGPLLVVAPEGEADPLITDVLDLLAFRTIRTATPEQFAALEERGTAGISEALSPFDLIVFDRVAAPFLPPVASISFGAMPPVPGVDLVDASRGVEVPRSGAEAGGSSGAGPVVQRLSRRVLSWDRDHPVMANLELGDLAVADPTRLRITEELDYARRLVIADGGPVVGLFANVPIITPDLQARIDEWTRAAATQGDAGAAGADPAGDAAGGAGAAAPLPQTEDPTAGDSGPPAADGAVNPLTDALGSGRLVARNPAAHLVVAFDLVRSNWPIDRTFALFLKNAVDQLTTAGETDRGRWQRAEDSARAVLASGDLPSLDAVRIEGPRTLVVPVEDDGNVTIPPLERVGFYTAPDLAPPHDRMVVNILSAMESDLRPVWAIDLNDREAAQARAVGETVPFEAWPWFVAAALLVLTAEWMLFALRTRS